jgi:hypothetical protein
MRKVLYMLAVAAALAVGGAAIATAAQGARCGTLYTPVCTPPGITIKIPPKCKNAGTPVTVKVVAKSSAGIRSIKVVYHGKTIGNFTGTGLGPTSKTLRVRITTSGLKAGVYVLRITTTDVTGKKVSKTVHFTICKPAIIHFTG